MDKARAKEIFKLMPVTDKIVVIAGIGFILFSIGYFVNLIFLVKDKVGFDVIKISGANERAIYDPSVEFTPAGDRGYLAYVELQKDMISGEPLVHVQIAQSTTQGKRWSKVKQVFESKKSELTSSSSLEPIAQGAWRYEMPSLVYDPEDPGKEWKIYAQRYFWSGDMKLARLYSMISYRYASSPEGVWSEEKWLFSGRKTLPPAPYNHLVQNALDDLHPSLKDLSFYADPSVLAKNGVLFMTLSGFTDKDLIRADRIILLASLDHGKSWIFVETLLSKEQLTQFGQYTRMGGASLIEYKNNVHLLITMGDEQVNSQGTTVFSFENFPNGILVLDENGLPKIVNHIPLKGSTFSRLGGGAADFDEHDVYGGLLIPEAIAGTREFVIYKTELMPVPAEK